MHSYRPAIELRVDRAGDQFMPARETDGGGILRRPKTAGLRADPCPHLGRLVDHNAISQSTAPFSMTTSVPSQRVSTPREAACIRSEPAKPTPFKPCQYL